MKTQFQPELLRETYSKYEDESVLAAAREAAASSVVSWRFASGDMSIDEPFTKELYGTNATWRKESAKPGKKDLRHGLDSEGRICLVQTAEGEHVCHLEHLGSYTLRIDFYPSIRRFDYDDSGTLVGCHILFAGHGMQREYNWENGTLQSVEMIGWNQPYKSALTPWADFTIASRVLQRYLYDELGLFQIVDQYLTDDGAIDARIKESIEYVRIPAGVTASGLAKEIASVIVRDTPGLVKSAADPESTYYALLLCYCAEEPSAGWPPFLLLANESILQTKGWSAENLKYVAWAPDELREMEENVEFAYSDPKLLELCSLHSQIMLAKGAASMKSALRDIVAALREVNWPDLMKTTDSFVVAAVDNTGEVDPARDIKAFAPEEFRQLKLRGMI